jgi:hypothetical protein
MKTLYLETDDVRPARHTIARIAGELLAARVGAGLIAEVPADVKEQIVADAIDIFELTGQRVVKETEDHRRFISVQKGAKV